MTKATPVPISGAVLRWAIQESGLTEREIAQRLQVPSHLVREWEDEQTAPTKTEFARLAELLKRPSSIFFLPEPPRTAVQSMSFRRASSGEQAARLTPDEARWLRIASRLQEAASLILSRLDERPVGLPHYDPRVSPEEAGEHERVRSEISVKTQSGWRDASQAKREWRSFLESQGIIVFQLRLGRDGCRGFSLWDERAPIVAINTAYNQPARIYTLFHELAHLLTRTNSVCGDLRILPKADHDVERWCERFAASFLLPHEALGAYLESTFRSGIVDSEGIRVVSGVAARFKVSLRAAALRLISLGLAGEELYSQVDRIAIVKEKERRGGGGPTLKRHERRIAEFGHRLPGLLLEANRRAILDTYDVLDYLDISTEDLGNLKKELVG